MREQPRFRLLCGGFERWLELLDGALVTDFDDAERLVHGEPVAGRVGDGLVVRQDLHQVVRVPGVRGENDAAPEGVDSDRPYPVVPAAVDLL